MHKPEFIMKCILIIKLYLPMYVLKKKKIKHSFDGHKFVWKNFYTSIEQYFNICPILALIGRCSWWKDKVLAKGKLYTENSVERTPCTYLYH